MDQVGLLYLALLVGLEGHVVQLFLEVLEVQQDQLALSYQEDLGLHVPLQDLVPHLVH